MKQRNSLLLPLAGIGLGGWALSRLIRHLRLGAAQGYFEGKVVVITGASRGIGRALAHAFAAQGANLVLAARNERQLLDVAAECEAITPSIRALVVPTDVTVEAQLENLVNTALERLGRIDILVNNAGIIQGGEFVALGRESVRKQVEVNLLAVMRLTQLALPAMLSQGEGHIVNMASAAGRHTVPYFVTYGTTKHGLIGFSEGLRRELAGTGVRVLSVNPGFTESDVVAAIRDTLRRMGFKILSPEYVARRTLEAIILQQPEVNIGLLETVGGWGSALFPRITDLFWRIVPPPDFAEKAAQQRTE
ncbi:MAG TPA: SDR family NAD(P)-dependent oxidoreductase [Chloroflexi bacterium]|nr:SDR family NAD(P)-dependent oxidoreductase [Chloroflexota bacterium]